MADAYILDAVRTPRGRGKKNAGALSGIHPQELLAQTLHALAGRTGIDRREVDDVVVGCVSQVKEQGANLARNAEVLADSVNRTAASIEEMNASLDQTAANGEVLT